MRWLQKMDTSAYRRVYTGFMAFDIGGPLSGIVERLVYAIEFNLAGNRE
jgi:hypothetical protein